MKHSTAEKIIGCLVAFMLVVTILSGFTVSAAVGLFTMAIAGGATFIAFLFYLNSTMNRKDSGQ